MIKVEQEMFSSYILVFVMFLRVITPSLTFDELSDQEPVYELKDPNGAQEEDACICGVTSWTCCRKRSFSKASCCSLGH